jgi:hypothetical protein
MTEPSPQGYRGTLSIVSGSRFSEIWRFSILLKLDYDLGHETALFERGTQT